MTMRAVITQRKNCRARIVATSTAAIGPRRLSDRQLQQNKSSDHQRKTSLPRHRHECRLTSDTVWKPKASSSTRQARRTTGSIPADSCGKNKKMQKERESTTTRGRIWLSFDRDGFRRQTRLSPMCTYGGPAKAIKESAEKIRGPCHTIFSSTARTLLLVWQSVSYFLTSDVTDILFVTVCSFE